MWILFIFISCVLIWFLNVSISERIEKCSAGKTKTTEKKKKIDEISANEDKKKKI